VRAGLPERIRQQARLEFALFSGVQKESPLSSVEQARGLALAADADLLIGVGGGSAIVTTRAVAVLLRKDGHDVRNVLVPTTPTTAMSRSGAAVLDTVQQLRIEHYDPGARAAAVLLDVPALLSAPMPLFRDAAAAAFCSAVELLTVPALHPLAFADAQAAVNILGGALPEFIERPDDAELRLLIGSAGFLAGRAGDSLPGVSPGIMHALAHQLQVRHGAAQGAAMSCLISAGLRYDMAESPDLELRVRSALGGLAVSVADLLEDVLSRAGLPFRLRDLSLDREQLPEVAENSMTGFFATRASRPPSQPEDLLRVLEDAW
jgi:alcohol dehydrogenase class IV